MDVLLPGNEVEAFGQRFALEPLILSESFFQEISQVIGMAEVLVPVDSMLIGKTIIESELRARAGLTVIGLRRGQITWELGLLEEKLQAGDTLLVIASWKHIKRLRSDEKDVLLLTLPTEFDEVLPVGGKALHAMSCLAFVVGLMISGVVPNVQAALLGCLLMGILGCVDLNSAYRAIDWKTIVLIVGMMPFSTALERTGGAQTHDRRFDSGCRRGRSSRRSRVSLHDHGVTGDVHFEHRHSRADGAGSNHPRQGFERVTLSVRNDRRTGRVHCLRHTGIVASQHAGGHARELHVWRLRPRRSAIRRDRDGRQCASRSVVVSVLTQPFVEHFSLNTNDLGCRTTRLCVLSRIVPRLGVCRVWRDHLASYHAKTLTARKGRSRVRVFAAQATGSFVIKSEHTSRLGAQNKANSHSVHASPVHRER